MGAEVLAFPDGFDYAYMLRYDLQRILGRTVPLAMLTDSESLFKTILKSTTTTEKRLMIDMQAAREAYGKKEISDVEWIRSEENSADKLTKSVPCSALEHVMDTGKVSTQVQQWVVRTRLPREQQNNDTTPTSVSKKSECRKTGAL